jgi:hypothetical protein
VLQKIRSARSHASLAALVVALSALLSLSGPVRAAEDHDHDHNHEHGAGHSHKPKHGGIVQEAGDYDFELVLKPDSARLYVSGHEEKDVPLKGGKATITILKGGATTKLVLVPGTGNWLEAKGVVPVGKGVRAVAVVLLNGKSTSVRFATT